MRKSVEIKNGSIGNLHKILPERFEVFAVLTKTINPLLIVLLFADYTPKNTDKSDFGQLTIPFFVLYLGAMKGIKDDPISVPFIIKTAQGASK